MLTGFLLLIAAILMAAVARALDTVAIGETGWRPGSFKYGVLLGTSLAMTVGAFACLVMGIVKMALAVLSQ